MYGLTEAFRSTYLPPEEVDRRPDSIGKAIPNAEILVLREDGTECAAGEPGELVHRGALVGMGYWNDAEKTAERYKLLPPPPAPLRASAALLARRSGILMRWISAILDMRMASAIWLPSPPSASSRSSCSRFTSSSVEAMAAAPSASAGPVHGGG